MSFKSILRKIKRIFFSEIDLEFLRSIRDYEIDFIISQLKSLDISNPKILELGGGAGWQALKLTEVGYTVCSIDVPSSKYLSNKVFDVQLYDGEIIPYENDHFDVVLSSNVLEHVPNIGAMQLEIYRVLKPNGICIHLIPNPKWRFLTNLTSFIKHGRLKLKPHGEHAKNRISEFYYFSKAFWINIFSSSCFKLNSFKTTPLLYSGESLFGKRISIKKRRVLAKFFGGSCNCYILSK